MPAIAMHITIQGRVQGVGYRAWAVHEASRLGLAGWVRNLANGNVEALAQGDGSQVERFVEACQRGPGLARVDHLEAQPAPPEDDLNGFTIRYQS